MDKFQVDFTGIARMFDPNRLPLKGNEHKLVRVAFDLFRVDGDEADDLWQIQADDDGNEFLVRTYALDGEEEKVSSASDWSVLADKKYANLTVSFMGVPLTRIASKDYGAEDPHSGKSLQGVVSRKLSTDGEFALKLLQTLPQEKLAALKQAGLLQKITDWLQSKDITDPIIAEIKDLVDQSVPGYKENFEENEEELELEEQEAADPKKGPSIPVGDLASEDQEWSLAFLNLHLTKTADIQDTPDFYTPGSSSSGVDLINLSDDVVQNAPPPIPASEKFDVTDVDSGEGEWAPEDIELSEEDLEEVDSGNVKKILEEIDALAPEDKQALETYFKS